MKLRYITGIFCFLAAFGLSVFLVRLSTPLSCSAPVSFEKEQTIVVNSETELQVRIRKFLEADRQTGRELSEDMANFRSDSDTFTVERKATSNLVKKMQRVECKNLTKDFCAAWEKHLKAWAKKDKFLQQGNDRSEYLKIEREINQTYYSMVGVAEKYGVYFTY